MKSVLMISAAALALAVTSQANAAKVGNDGVGYFDISGTAGSYCVLGETHAGDHGGTNTSIDVSGFDGFLGKTGSDAQITITSLQKNGNIDTSGANNAKGDTAAAWSAVFNLRHTICNSSYTVSASSQNSGLEYQGIYSGNGFSKNLDYTLEIAFDGNDKTKKAKNLQTSQPGTTFFTSNNASRGDMKVTFTGQADPSAYLLEGDYTDQVVITLAPSVSGDA